MPHLNDAVTCDADAAEASARGSPFLDAGVDESVHCETCRSAALLEPIGEGTVDDALVRERIREMLAARRLPAADPVKLWAGPSMGKPCNACGETIRTATEYELDFVPTLTLLLHPRCYAIWNEERRRGTAPSVSAEDAS
jgi:hypothetical protein